MIKLLIVALCFFVPKTVSIETIYGLSINGIEGSVRSLSAYEGKKILIITLPTQQNAANNTLLKSLDSLQSAYSSSIAIIATPCYEDGFTLARKNELQQWYRSKLGQQIFITDGLYSRKTSGTQQHPLFRWLTDHNRNSHFDNDVTGPGSKFIVWADGELTGVLEPTTRLGGSVMHSLLQAQ